MFVKSNSRALARESRALAAVFAALAMLLIFSASAFAAGTASVSGTDVTFTAANGDTNTVDYSTDNDGYIVTDTNDITAGSGCTAISASSVHCGDVDSTSLTINLGNQNDTATAYNGDAVAGVSIFGGDGDDTFTGGDGDETMDGGLGDDIFNPNGGYDQLSYMDRTTDLVIDVGSTSGESGEADEISSTDSFEAYALGSGDDNFYGLSNSVAPIVSGGSGDDYIRLSWYHTGQAAYGDAGDDILYSYPGDDTLSGGDGNDTLEGGDGNDTLVGEAGDDILNAGEGDDSADAGEGNDWVDGGLGDDSFAPGDGTDHLSYASRTAALIIDVGGVSGQSGEIDLISSSDSFESYELGSGADNFYGLSNNVAADVYGGAGNDYIRLPWYQTGQTAYGEAGNDILYSYAGNDSLDGGDGNDTINAGTGNDSIDGGDGNDSIDGGLGADTFLPGAGTDHLTYATRTAALVIDVGGGGSGQSGENDYISSSDGFETYTLGSGNDSYLGQSNGNAATVYGGNGNDLLKASDVGGDNLQGQAGVDILYGYAGNDTLTGGTGADTVYGGNDDDTVLIQDGTIDTADCGAGTDSLTADGNDVTSNCAP